MTDLAMALRVTPELTHFDIHRDEFMATYPAFVAGCGVTEVAA